MAAMAIEDEEPPSTSCPLLREAVKHLLELGQSKLII